MPLGPGTQYSDSGVSDQEYLNTISAQLLRAKAVVIVDQNGIPTPISGTGGALTDTQLRATPVPISGTVTATGGLTDTQLRASSVPVSLATAPTTPVTGTFWQATQPVSAASLPLPTGAATETTLGLVSGSDMTTPVPAMPAGGIGIRGWLSAIWTKINASLAVTGTFWQATQPVSGTFWQATQPVSGTVTANAGTNLNTSALALDATLTGGTAQSKITDGSNIAAVKAASTAAVAADRALVVALSPNNPALADATASGNITTQNLNSGGVATAGSAVALTLHSGQAVLGIQVTGTYTGALSVQVTLDDATWVTLTGSQILTSALAASPSIGSGSAGTFTVNVAGYSQARVTGLAAMTGTAVVTLRAAASLSVLSSIAGTVNILGSVTSTPSYGLGSTTLIGDYALQYRGTTTGAAARSKVVSAASTNATVVKGSAGRLIGWALTGTTAAIKYFHIYNQIGSPTVGTDVPYFTIAIPASGSVQQNFPGGIAMSTGIAYSITNLAADLDATAVALGDVIGCLFYA